MRIYLYNDQEDETPSHEFDAHKPTHITQDSIIHWAPTDQHYTYMDSDGETFIKFVLTPVVTINVSIG